MILHKKCLCVSFLLCAALFYGSVHVWIRMKKSNALFGGFTGNIFAETSSTPFGPIITSTVQFAGSNSVKTVQRIEYSHPDEKKLNEQIKNVWSFGVTANYSHDFYKTSSDIRCIDPASFKNYQRIRGERKQVAIIIPYKGRASHFNFFIEHFKKFFYTIPNDRTRFSLWLVEQAYEGLFNRGLLFNVGVQVSAASFDLACVVLHDIDRLPQGGVDYSQCDIPTQLSSECSDFKWSVPYRDYSGGVVAISPSHYMLINGFANTFEGWGGEDDEFFGRLKSKKLLNLTTKTINRPAAGHGRFVHVGSNHTARVRGDTYASKVEVVRALRRGVGFGRFELDGLRQLAQTNVSYCVASVLDHDYLPIFKVAVWKVL